MIDPQTIPSIEEAAGHYTSPAAFLAWLEARHDLDLATLAAMAGGVGEGEDYPPPPAAGALPVEEIPDPLKE